MRDSLPNPVAEFVTRQGIMVLDGGLATALESRGWDLDDELWSAKVLMEAPEAIGQVHRDFLAAGADCIATSSYQASLQGFRKRGLSRERGAELLSHSVRLAIDARDGFWSEPENRTGRLRPLVAASVGPYGAFLADGSEYTGRYSVDDDELYEFHRGRWQILADSEADMIACETIPSRTEARVLLRLLRETPNAWAWLSFSCCDGAHLCGGSRLADVVRVCDDEPQVAAIGINCTSPEFISSLIRVARRATSKPVIVYPNLGEQYDATQKTWAGRSVPIDWAAASAEWSRLGAAGIGGCCRVRPEDISAMRRQLVP